MLGMRSTTSGARTPAAGRTGGGALRMGYVGGVLLHHGGQVLGDHHVGLAEFPDPPLLQPQRAVADRLHVADGVRDEQDGDAARPQFVHLAHAALAEVDVAHGQRLVHEQDLRVHMDRHGEGQPHHHAAGVGLHGLVDEVADFGEFLNFACTYGQSRLGENPGWRRSGRRCRGRVNSGLKPEPSSSRAETRPLTSAEPAVGCRIPATICSSVLLPAPFSPMTQKVSPLPDRES